MFDVTAFEKKTKSRSGFKKLNSDEWCYIFSAGLNSIDYLKNNIQGNWYEKAKENEKFLTSLTINLYFVNKYLIDISEANFNDNNQLILKPKIYGYYRDENYPPLVETLNIHYLNLWKHFLDYGITKTKISDDCRLYTEYISLLDNAKELKIESIGKGLLELKGFSHYFQKVDVSDDNQQESEDNETQNLNVRRRR